jgi:hypothetical protein
MLMELDNFLKSGLTAIPSDNVNHFSKGISVQFDVRSPRLLLVDEGGAGNLVLVKCLKFILMKLY